MPDDLRPSPESKPLLRCPWCDAPGELVHHTEADYRAHWYFDVVCTNHGKASDGEDDCWMAGPYGKTADEAIRRWNRRALTINPDDPKQIERVARELFDQHYTYEDDSSSEWRDQYWRYVAAPALEHKGDCPHAEHKGPITCDRCVVDDWRERARAVLKALSDA